MNKLSKLILGFSSTLLLYSAAYSTNVPNTDKPVTFVGPTGRLGYTSSVNNYIAYNVAGEAGLKNFRVGGTLGWKMDEYQRFKLSAEYLWQKITYAFFSGNSDQWVNQGAVGATYQYLFADNRFRPQFDLGGYYSHAPSKSLNTVSGTGINSSGLVQPFIDNRRIAGSDAVGFSPGFALMPWRGGRIGAAVNYDNVRYNTINVPNEDAKGLGGTVNLNQAITDNVNLGLSAAIRQPFNNYAANLNWIYMPSPYYGKWMLGLFGEYNVGKKTLPDTYNAGVSADYFFDQRCETIPVRFNLKGERNLKGEVSTALQPVLDDFLAWTAEPAVYMPQVLAIVDPNVQLCTNGTAPALISPLPSFTGPATITDSNAHTFNSPSQFSGKVTYTLSASFFSGFGDDPPPPPANKVFSINSQTGAVTLASGFQFDDQVYQLIVTAANACGSVSSTFYVEIDNQ